MKINGSFLAGPYSWGFDPENENQTQTKEKDQTTEKDKKEPEAEPKDVDGDSQMVSIIISQRQISTKPCKANNMQNKVIQL